jgi:hypothetical protein
MASAEMNETEQALFAENESLRTKLANVEAESLRRGKMLLRYRDVIANINDTLQDEGDRAYLGSTNDVYSIKEISTALEDFGWDQIRIESGKRDVFADLRNANAYIRLLEENGDLARLGNANEKRALLWDPDSKLDSSFHSNEFAGELAELAIVCNVIKKLERERLGIKGSRDTVEHLGSELADVVICASKIAVRYKISLWSYIVGKFNATSEAQGFDCFLLSSAKEAI